MKKQKGGYLDRQNKTTRGNYFPQKNYSMDPQSFQKIQASLEKFNLGGLGLLDNSNSTTLMKKAQLRYNNSGHGEIVARKKLQGKFGRGSKCGSIDDIVSVNEYVRNAGMAKTQGTGTEKNMRHISNQFKKQLELKTGIMGANF
jgi:hypothetical protein